jgi:alpha-N-arabinofuranosidase
VCTDVNVISWLQPARTESSHPSYYASNSSPRPRAGPGRCGENQPAGTILHDAVPALDVSASFDPETQQGAVFLVNRSLTDAVTTDLARRTVKPFWLNGLQLAGSDPKAVNTWNP